MFDFQKFHGLTQTWWIPDVEQNQELVAAPRQSNLPLRTQLTVGEQYC